MTPVAQASSPANESPGSMLSMPNAHARVTPGIAIPVIVAVAALALFPLTAGIWGVDFVTKIMVYAIFALSLELLVGQTGLVSFGHAAFFGIGGYVAVLLSPRYEAVSLGG